MTDIFYSDMTYCSTCDQYFPGEEARAEHVQFSNKHPKCDTCDRRFANMNSLRNHWVYSARHHYCSVCRKHFATAGGFQVHVEMSAIHRDDSDDEDEDDDDIDDTFEGWEDVLASIRYPEESTEGGPPAADDEEYGPSDEYWDEDDETEFEEDRDTYYGFASVSAVGGTTMPAPTPMTAVNPFGPDPEEAGLSSARSGTPGSDSSSSSTAYTSGSSSSDPFSTAEASSSSSSIDTMDRPASAAVPVEHNHDHAPKYGCPLCLEAPQQTSATRCGHIFCTSCITTALQRKRVCPVCREFACTRQLRQIYLPMLS